jgi:hypothetical protein
VPGSPWKGRSLKHRGFPGWDRQGVDNPRWMEAVSMVTALMVTHPRLTSKRSELVQVEFVIVVIVVLGLLGLPLLDR